MEGRGEGGKCFKFKKNSDSEDRLFENAQVEDKNAQMKDKTGLKNEKKVQRIVRQHQKCKYSGYWCSRRMCECQAVRKYIGRNNNIKLLNPTGHKYTIQKSQKSGWEWWYTPLIQPLWSLINTTISKPVKPT